MDSVLADAFERLARTDIATRHPSERAVLAAKLLGSQSSMPELQMTVIDSRAGLVFHAESLSGNVLGHRDVRGRSVYGSIAEDARSGGSLANSDFLSEDLRAARENYVAWRKLGDIAVIVEGHEWRAME